MIEVIGRYINTGLGVSARAYKNQHGQPKIQGEIQGKGNVASLWTMASILLLFAHAMLYTGLSLPSVVGKKGIKKKTINMRMM